MNNAERYLKDDRFEPELREDLASFLFDNLGFYDGTEETINEVIADYFKEEAVPLLSTKERIILENVSKEWNLIGRNPFGYLYLIKGEDTAVPAGFSMYNHLFSCVKKGEYFIKELLNNDKC